jgi:hypothetical protein
VRAVDEFTAVLRESVDPACLRASRRGPPDRAQALALLVRFGQLALDRYIAAIDQPAANAAFHAAAGPNAMVEARRLAAEPKVRELLALMQQIQLNAAVDFILEQLRNQEANGFARRVDFVAFASDFAFVRDRHAADRELGQRLRAQAAGQGPEFDRLIDLANAWTFASVRHTDLSRATSRTLEGFVPALRAACIGRR